jgi:3-methylcrotonyl-CoA carboxylase alpha subunit
MITGVDLVEWQLRVAAGEPLPLTQTEIKIHGHAIEARLCAEKPAQQFLPATGHLKRLKFPTGAAFTRNQSTRFDAGVVEGDDISPFYDSMVAKIIVHGQTREMALRKLALVLSQVELVGVDTNLVFLQRLLALPAFFEADLDTGMIANHTDLLFPEQNLPDVRQCVLALTYFLRDRFLSSSNEPWVRNTGFRNHLPVVESWNLSCQTHDFSEVRPDIFQTISLRTRFDGELELSLDQKIWCSLKVLSRSKVDDEWHVQWGDLSLKGRVWSDGEQVYLFDGLQTQTINIQNRLAFRLEDRQDFAHQGGLTSTMPGKVVRWLVETGQSVKRGQPLVVLEAMKMEHTLTVPFDGVVQELFYQVGEQVSEGVRLLDVQTTPS